MRGDEVGRHTDRLGFGGVRIGDVATLDDIGRPGNFRQQAGDQSAGAAFGRDDREAGAPQLLEQSFGAGDERRRKHRAGPRGISRR